LVRASFSIRYRQAPELATAYRAGGPSVQTAPTARPGGAQRLTGATDD